MKSYGQRSRWDLEPVERMPWVVPLACCGFEAQLHDSLSFWKLTLVVPPQQRAGETEAPKDPGVPVKFLQHRGDKKNAVERDNRGGNY